MNYSHSRIDVFYQCKLRYKLQYVDGISPERESIETFMGSQVHKALYKLYRDLQLSQIDTKKELTRSYRDGWENNWHRGVFVTRRGFKPRDYRDKGELFVGSFYDHHYPFDDGITVLLEESIVFPLDSEGKYHIHGVIDRLVDKSNGRYEIHDYKTSKNLPEQRVLDSDRQLAIYQLAVQHSFPDMRDIDLVWHYLAFNKELRSRRSDKELEDLKIRIMSMIEIIENSDRYEANKSPLCGWCNYSHICPAN